MSNHRSSALYGRTVALLHPAWHSCGTYSVIVGQIAAYRALGARVLPIAVGADPGFVPGRKWIWRDFLAATPELDAGERYCAGAPFSAVLGPVFLRDVLWPYVHGDQAVIRTGLISRAKLPPELETQAFDLIHCNHFFLMPLAKRLSRGATPILLDSHDLQARQFVLMNERIPWLKPRATYEQMLAQELEEMRGADLLLHLNAEEEAEFSALLPEKEHTLLYPPVPEAPTGPGGPDIVLIASNNTANVESVVWFLREVAPKAREKAPGVRVKIAGNVESGVRARAPEIYDAYKDWFLGRVEDLGAVYANARLALLPTIDGHGLSIKSVEAMASGLPLVATTHALRGMRADARALDGVTIADGAEAFAAALTRAAGGGAIPSETERRASAPRRYYDAHFSLAAYERSLAALAERLLRV